MIKAITINIAMILLRKHRMKNLKTKLKILMMQEKQLQALKKEVKQRHRKVTGGKNLESNHKNKFKLT